MLITPIERVPSRSERIIQHTTEVAERLRADRDHVVANVFCDMAKWYHDALEQSHDHIMVLDHMAKRACEIDGEIKKRLSQHPVANG